MHGHKQQKPSKAVIADRPALAREAAPSLAPPGLDSIVKTGPFSGQVGRGLSSAPRLGRKECGKGCAGAVEVRHGAGVWADRRQDSVASMAGRMAA